MPRLTRFKAVAFTLVVLVFGLLAAVLVRSDLNTFQAWTANLNSASFLVLLSMLPLVGFPVSILYFLVGANFGFVFGFFLTAVSIAVNLLATHWLASGFLRQTLRSLLARTRFRFPEFSRMEHRSVALLGVFLPGPYAVKNYLLALGGLPLRSFLGICLPAYAFRASFGLLFGRFSQEVSPLKITLVVAYGIAVGLLCRGIIRRLRAQTPGRSIGEIEVNAAS